MSDNMGRGWLAAICAASLVPAIPFAAWLPLALVVFVAAFLVAAVHALLFGLPLFHLLSRQGRPGVAAALIGGLAVGALPSLVLITVMDPSSGALLGDPAMLEGLEQRAPYLVMPLAFGISGLAGGLAFWLVALRGAED
jgi:hypothetical protein